MEDEKELYYKRQLSSKDERVEALEREIRQLKHEVNQKESELQMNLDNSNSKIKSLESLVASMKESNQENTSKFIIKDLENKILDQDNKINLLEQTEMNLTRQIHSQNVELKDLKVEIDKMILMGTGNKKESKVNTGSSDAFENMDDDTKELLTNLMQEIEDLKKEKMDFQEKALTRITEKELENLELKETLDSYKNEYQKEINEMMMKINELTADSKLEDDNDDAKSEASINQQELLDKISELEQLLLEAKDELDNQTNEKESILRENENMESEYKQKIGNLENTINILKTEVNRIEIEKLEIQRELTADSDSKDVFYKTIEEFQTKLKMMEEQKEKDDERHRTQYEELLNKLDENETKLKSITTKYNSSKLELSKLKESQEKTKNDQDSKYIKDIDLKDKEIKILSSKYDIVNKEYNNLKQEYEKNNKLNEKHRNNLIELQDTLCQLKRNHEQEIKIIEDKYNELEKRFDSEKNKLIEENGKLTKQVNNNTSMSSKALNKQDTTLNTLKEDIVDFVEEERLNTLDDVMNDEGNDNEDKAMLKMRIVQLESQITCLGNNVFELKEHIGKLKQENDLLTKDIQAKKEEYASSKKLYEEQIHNLQKNTNKINVERNSLRKSLVSGDDSVGLTPKQMQILAELNKTISNLKAENTFLVDSQELLKKEVADVKDLREKDIMYYKEEVKKAEKIAVNAKIQFASYVFEKEEEIIKLKQINKKLMDKMGLTFA